MIPASLRLLLSGRVCACGRACERGWGVRLGVHGGACVRDLARTWAWVCFFFFLKSKEHFIVCMF